MLVFHACEYQADEMLDVFDVRVRLLSLTRDLLLLRLRLLSCIRTASLRFYLSVHDEVHASGIVLVTIYSCWCIALHELCHGAESAGVSHPTFFNLHACANPFHDFVKIAVMLENAFDGLSEGSNGHLGRILTEAFFELGNVTHIDVKMVEEVVELD